MEQLYNKSGGKPLHQDPEHHIRKATTFEDLGTSKFTRKSQSKLAPGTRKPSNEQKRPAPTRPTRPAVLDLEDDDSDEMDLLSESNCPEDDDSTFPSSQTAVPKDDPMKRHLNVSTAIKSLSFKKKSSTSTPDPTSSSVPDSKPKSQRVASTGIKDLASKPSAASSPPDEPTVEILRSTSTRPKPRPRSKPVDDSYDTPLPKPKPRRPNVQSSKTAPPRTKASLDPFPLSPAAIHKAVRQKNEPAPFPLAADSDVETSSPRLAASSSKLAKQPSLAKFPLTPSQDQEDRSSQVRKEKTREAMPFPLDLPSRDSLGNEDDGSRSSSKGGKENDKGKAKASSNVRKGSPSRRKCGSRKTILSSDDDEEPSPPTKVSKKSLPHAAPKKGRDLSKKQSSLKPFPLSGGPASPSLGKRVSEDGSDGDRTSKKRREFNILDSPTRTFFDDDEGDSLLFTSVADPKTLCPYCDEPLPSTPSPRLLTLLKQTRAKSRKDPRPGNVLGLSAKLEHFSNVCSRHRFEQTLLPQAEREGWPRTIKWDKLEDRIIKMKPYLEGLVDGSNKGQSPFWNTVLKEVESKGSRAVTGVHGQFANFEKVQPGYYGELGSVIIHQALFGIFPATAFDPSVIQPLTVSEFILLVLVPEVATRLIMEDKDLEGERGIRQAISIMQASAFYGSSMFPEDAGDGEERQMGVGDRMIMERAMKRRKEIEEEEDAEEKVKQEEESAHEKMTASESRGARAARRANGALKEVKKELAAPPSTSAIPPQNSQPKPRPRARPIVKSESNMSVCSDNEDPPLSSSAPRSKLVAGSANPSKSSASRTVRRSGRSHLTKVESDMEMETDRSVDVNEEPQSEAESESGGLNSRKAPRSLRRSPSASEWAGHDPDPKSKPKPRSKAIGSTSAGKQKHRKGYVSTSESDADMESDASSKAAVGRSTRDQELKTPVASRRPGLRGGVGRAGIGNAQAPVATALWDADVTPRPPRRGDPVNVLSGDEPVLIRAGRRAREQQSKDVIWERNMRADPVDSPRGSFNWLLDDE